MPGEMARLICRSLLASAASESQTGRADPLAAVPHQPVNVIFAFPDIECALEKCVSFSSFLDGGHADALGKVQRLFFAVVGHHAKNNGQEVF